MTPSRRAAARWEDLGGRFCTAPRWRSVPCIWGAMYASNRHWIISCSNSPRWCPRELDCKHEWAAHVNHAQKAGISMETIRAVYEKKGVETFSADDAAIVSFVREMIHKHRVSEATFQAVYGRLGEKKMVELTATIGYYAMLACTLNTFDIYTVTPPEDLKI